MKKKARSKPSLNPPDNMTDLGQRFVRLGEALQDENTKLCNLVTLSWSCGLLLRFSLIPKKNPVMDASDRE